MRWPLLLVLFSLACSEPAEEPPTLPGNEAPPCELGPERYFLIDRVAIPIGGQFAYDLSIPPRRVTSPNDPHYYLQWSTTTLAPAIDRAFANHHILWVLVTSSCSTMNHHRVGLRRGISFSDPMIELDTDDRLVWGVGERNGATIDANYGIGAGPYALTVDAAADTSVTDWFEGHAVSTRFELDGNHVTGEIAFAVETTLALPALGRAVSNTLEAARAEHPMCPGPECVDGWLDTLLNVFDLNGNLVVEPDEAANEDLLDDFLNVRPRFDILSGEDAIYWPDHDEILESDKAVFKIRGVEVYLP